MLLKDNICKGCVLETLGQGFMQTSGTGKNGVLLCGEALGETEAEQGVPFVGAAGKLLDKYMVMGGLNREDFLIANAVWCRPPENKLAGMWYMQDALNHCSPHLDSVIASFKPKVIVALGAIAAKRLIPDLPVGITEARGYVFWSEKYQTWILPTIHPSFIMRGKTSWAQVLIHDLQRSIDIATNGYKYAEPNYLLDPIPLEAMRWVEEFEEYYNDHPDLYLSTDIETPDKDADEEALDLESSGTYTLLRCGYSYRDRHALSIPWDGPYRAVHERLLRLGCQKLFWNGSFDVPRIIANGIVVGGTIHDAMDAWHVLNSDLKKALGFVTPFFVHDQPMWKHLSNSKPAYYNAVDADVAGMNMRGTVRLLKQHGMWPVYVEFIEELDPVYSAMTRAGMPVDITRRIESSRKLIKLRDDVRRRINEIVPDEIKTLTPKNGFVKPPKDIEGLVEVVFGGIKVKRCPNCNEKNPKKSHFKVYKKKDNPCGGLEPVIQIEGEKRYARVEPFVPSTKGIFKYQQFHKHKMEFVGKGAEKKYTSDEKAIKKAIGRYPEDEFYKLTLEDRELTKVLGTYIGYADEN